MSSIIDQLRRQHETLTRPAPGLTTAPASAPAIERLKLAPFASDPARTLRPGRLMVVSMKPYGAPGRSYPFGWDERAARPGLHRWYDGDRAGGNFVREADQLLRGVLAAMGLSTDPREVFNTYAYFWRAHDARQLKSFGLERVDCAPYHRAFLAIVDPEVVLCIGNGPPPSAFALYRRLLGPDAVAEATPAPRTKVRSFRAGGRLVVGVPHLSYVRAGALLPTVTGLVAN